MNKLHLSTLFLILLLFLAACGGGDAQESDVQESPAEDTEIEEEAAPEEEAAEEAIEEPPLAIGSEDDSGALPPPINSGSKVTATSQASSVVIDVLFIVESSENTAVTIAELDENWEDTIEQINTLPTQPNAHYAAIILHPDEPSPFNVVDFSDSPSWVDWLTPNETLGTTAEPITNLATQLSWEESDSVQIVFILVSPEQFDDTLLLESDTAVYFPIITPELAPTAAELLNYDTIMETTNGRLIQLENNTQTTLSEQLILAVAEAITQTDE